MTVSKIRLPDNTEHDIRAKYLIQSSSSDAVSAEFSERIVTEDAIANIQKIYGNTVKWNQQVLPLYNTSFGTGLVINIGSDGKISLSGSSPSAGGRTSYVSSDTYKIHIITGHKYIHISAVPSSITPYVTNPNSASVTQGFPPRLIIQASSTFDGRLGFYFPANIDYTGVSFYSSIIDLTAIYGSGNEPTVAEFEAQYPAEYYPYDPGSLTSNSATAILSTGRNLFDEDAVFGSAQNISKVASGWSGAAGHFAAIGHVWDNIYGYGGQMCIYMKATADSSGGGFRPVFHYSDNTSSNGPVVGTSVDTYVLSSSGKVVSYIDLTYSSGRTIVIEKLCISYSDPTYDGTYEHYTEFHQIDLNIPTLTGKLNGAGSSVVIFPNGMQLNGTTRDELTATSAIKRIADDNSVLSTPQTYILDNALQLQYPVVAGGTEMVLPTTGTAPMKMDVIYGNAADAAATMSQSFISVDSMKEFLAALGTQMGGTWSMGYENGKHTFTFTSN